jgi:biopolymer transport protein ExbB
MTSVGGFFKHLPRGTVLRLLAGLLAVWLGMDLSSRYVAATRTQAQETKEINPSEEPKVEDVAPATAPATTGKADAKSTHERTFWDNLVASGLIGLVIIILSFVAVGLIIEHAISIRKERLMPEVVLQQLEEMIHHGQIAEATEFCRDPKNYSLSTDVILAGLETYQGSEFGFAEYKSAVEEAGEDNTARLYRKTDLLNLIAAIAPMLGLLGTVQGMILAFNQLANETKHPSPADLADNISLALVTTFEGLVVAIPAMAAFSYFRNKIDSLVSECGKRVERILMPLARKRTA